MITSVILAVDSARRSKNRRRGGLMRIWMQKILTFHRSATFLLMGVFSALGRRPLSICS